MQLIVEISDDQYKNIIELFARGSGYDSDFGYGQDEFLRRKVCEFIQERCISQAILEAGNQARADAETKARSEIVIK